MIIKTSIAVVAMLALVEPISGQIIASCELVRNPAHNNQYYPEEIDGYFGFNQSDAAANVEIDGDVGEARVGPHCLAIAENNWDGLDCATAGGHWNPAGETHGDMNAYPSHAGDLDFVWFLGENETIYSVTAEKFTMYGAESVLGKALVMYPGEGILGRDEENNTPKTNIFCYQ